MSCGWGKRWWRETLETAPGDFFLASTSLAAATDGDAPAKVAGVRGLTDRKRGGVLSRFMAVRSWVVAGIATGDQRNGGARWLTVVEHYTAVVREEEALFEPWSHPAARGGVCEGAEGPTATARMENAAAGGGEEVGGELDFRHHSPIPSARTAGTTRRRRFSAHTDSRCSRTAGLRILSRHVDDAMRGLDADVYEALCFLFFYFLNVLCGGNPL